MRKTLTILLLFICSLGYGQSSDFFSEADTFLKSFVKNGQVDYKAIKESPAQLEKLSQLIAAYNLSDQNKTTQKAFLLNTYNILAIKNVIDHYPIKSPLSVPGFFDRLKNKVAGEQMTLDQLEKGRLFKQFKDARLHLVLVCAAKSCPPLQPGIFTPTNLEEELENYTVQIINSNEFLVLKNGVLEVSELFRWYTHDFGDTKVFLNHYRSEKIPTDCKIKYTKYDWTLNEHSLKVNPNIIPYRASQLIPKGSNELKLFNSLYTQRMKDGFDNFNSRSTYYSMFGQYLRGINSNLNLGFDFVIRSNLLNDLDGNSPFNTLRFQKYNRFNTFNCNEGGFNLANNSPCHNAPGSPENSLDSLRNADGNILETTSDFGFASFGPKFKINPIKKWKNLTWQQTLYIPIQKSVDGNFISFTQIFYDKPIGSKSQLFIEASAWTLIAPNFRNSFFFKVFYSYFPTRRWTVYAMATIPNEAGIGSKYFITPNLEIELLYTRYNTLGFGTRDIQPSTFNLGLRSTW